MKKQSTIYVAGGETLIGAAILRALRQQGYRNVAGGRDEDPDLTDGAAVDAYLKRVPTGIRLSCCREIGRYCGEPEVSGQSDDGQPPGGMPRGAQRFSTWRRKASVPSEFLLLSRTMPAANERRDFADGPTGIH